MSSFSNDNLDSGYGDNTNAARRDNEDSYGSGNRQRAATFDSSDGSSGRDNSTNLNSHEPSGIENSSNSYNASGAGSYGTSGDNATYGSSRQTDSYGSSDQERATFGSSTGSLRDNEESYGTGGNANDHDNSYGGPPRTTDRHGSSDGHEMGLSPDAGRRDDGTYGAGRTEAYGGSSGDDAGSYGGAARNNDADNDSYGASTRGEGTAPARGADSAIGKFVEKAGALLHNDGIAEKGREKREQKGFGNGNEY